MLNHLLSPKSIAVIGGSDDLSKPGGNLVRNILVNHYAGDLLIVNPKSPVVQGIRTYPTVKDLPFTPELAMIVIPAPLVEQTVLDLAEMGTPAVIVMSAGFSEVSPEGKQAEQRLAEIARSRGMILLGPNCLGVASAHHAGLFAGLTPSLAPGGIDFLSGSGATIVFLAEPAVKRGLLFNSCLSVGNSALTGVEELLDLFDQEHDETSSPYKILYMEGIKQPGQFLRAARSLNQKGCVLAAIKGGTTGAGSRAAASHTGAMATNDTAVQALLDKAGIIRVQSRPELIDVATVLTCTRGKLDGRRVAIVTDAGGPGVLLADELNRQGFEVPPFKPSTRAKLNQVLLPGSSSANPVDCLPARNGRMMAQILEIIRTEEADTIDYILCVDGDSHLSDNWEVYQAILKEMETGTIPILPSFCTIISSHNALEKFKQAGKCYFDDEVAMARALGAVVNRPRVSEPVLEMPGFDRGRIAGLLEGQHGVLPAGLTRQVLEAAGLRFPGQVELTSAAELERVPFGFPWVMKVMGPVHKTDVGGVRLKIQSLEEARKTWAELQNIPGASGCLVQQMVSGSEVLLGANREEGYGHLVAFGLGGIYTEALKDVHFALAPLSAEEGGRLIRSLRALPLIKGVRGEAGMDLEQLNDALLRVSLLVTHFPQIKEMDLNPLKGSGRELFTVDARLILDS